MSAVDLRFSDVRPDALTVDSPDNTYKIETMGPQLCISFSQTASSEQIEAVSSCLKDIA